MRALSKQCPLCSEPLERITYEGIAAMRCPGCGGYLVQKNRLKGIQRNRQFPREALERSLEHTPGTDTDSRLQCPECHTTMQKDTHSFGVRLRLDVCPHCEAVWLDPGELEQAQMQFEESLAGRDLARLQRTWEEMPAERREQYERNRERLPDRPDYSDDNWPGNIFMRSLLRSLFGGGWLRGRW
jgi:Zn-finger nucleic acid-binding protein